MAVQQEMGPLTEELQTRMNRLRDLRVVGKSCTQPYGVTSRICVYLIAPTQGVYHREGNLFLPQGPQGYPAIQLPIRGQTYYKPFETVISTSHGTNPKVDALVDGFSLEGKEMILGDIKTNPMLEKQIVELGVTSAEEVFESLNV